MISGSVPHFALVNQLKIKIPKLGDRKFLKKMKLKNPKVLSHIRQQYLARKANYPMRGGMKEADWRKYINALNEALGDRLSNYNKHIAADGSVDMEKAGLWAFAALKKNDKGDEVIQEQGDSKGATHIYHRFGKFAITVDALKIKELDGGWLFKDPHLDFGCMLSNGAGLLVDFTIHTKYDKYYYVIDDKISKAYGSKDWMNDFGEHMQEKRKEKCEEIVKAEEAMAEIVENALLVGVVTPKRARKKAPACG